MATYGIIYMHTNKLNGKKYIGQTTKTLNARLKEHLKEMIKGSNLPFHRALKKYGIENFVSEIIDTANNQKELNEKEIKWIAHFNTYKGKGYNCTIGGEGYKAFGEKNHFYGKKHTEETKEKIS